MRGAQIVHQLLDLFVAGAAIERLAERILRLHAAPSRLADMLPSSMLHRHVPHARHDLAQRVVGLACSRLQ